MDIRILRDRDEVQRLRNKYAAEFIEAMRGKFPDPRDATRVQAEVMVDRWWPVVFQPEELVLRGMP